MERVRISAIQVLRFSVNFASFFHVLPIRWNKGKEIAKFEPYSWNPFSRFITLYAFPIYDGFILFQAARALLDFKKEDFETLIVELLFLFGITLVFVLEFFAVTRGRLIVLVLNQYMLFIRQIKELYSLPDQKRPPFEMELILFGGLLGVLSILIPMTAMLQFLHSPDLPYFIPILFLPDLNTYPLWAKFLVGCPLTWFYFSVWGAISGCCIIFFFETSTTIYLLSELRGPGKTSSVYTKNEIRHPARAFKIYKSLQLMIGGLNGVSQGFPILFFIYTTNVITVFSIYALITFHNRLPFTVFLMVLAIAVAGTLILIVTHIEFGGVNKTAIQFLNCWRTNREAIILLTHMERKLLRKYLRSFPPLKIYLGTFGVFDKLLTLRIVGKIVVYTIRFLMVMKSII